MINDDDVALAQLWDRDEQARDIAEQAIEALQEHVDLEEPSWKRRRVLDVGCGTGLLTAELAPFVGQLVAIDTSPAMLSVLSEKRIANVETRCGDIDDAPRLHNFDLIVASCVCGILPSFPSTVSRLAGALNPGGLFAHWDWLLPDGDADGDGLSLEAVKRAFKAADLTCVHADHAFDALFDEEPLLMGLALKMIIRG